MSRSVAAWSILLLCTVSDYCGAHAVFIAPVPNTSRTPKNTASKYTAAKQMTPPRRRRGSTQLGSECSCRRVRSIAAWPVLYWLHLTTAVSIPTSSPATRLRVPQRRQKGKRKKERRKGHKGWKGKKRENWFSKSQHTAAVVPQYLTKNKTKTRTQAIGSQPRPKQIRFEVVATGYSHVDRLYPLVGLVLCYPLCRLLAFFNNGFPTPFPTPFAFGHHASGLRGAPRSFLPPLRATWP